MLFLINRSGVPSIANWIHALPPLTGLPGDVNADGQVNAADYVSWRRAGGTLGEYYTWRSNFGATSGSGAVTNAAIPEPLSGVLLLMGAAMSALARVGRRIANQ
jgi:hypothetical protein